MKLTTRQFVNAVRALLDKPPLYDRTLNLVPSDSRGYARAEALRRAADPDCRRCGGAGYYDGWRNDDVCPCTRMATPVRGHGAPDAVGAVFMATRRR